MKRGSQVVAPPRERAALMGIAHPSRPGDAPGIDAAASLAELERLARTAGVQPVASLEQTVRRISPATYIGAGKVEELKHAVAASSAGVVLFDEALSPAQQRTLTE